jgi:catalase-peroxidase
MMTTADLALRMDPRYAPIARRFHQHPAQFADAFARAWFKLTHRDLGPRARYLGPEVPAEDADLAGPGPRGRSPARRGRRRRDAQGRRSCATGLTISELVTTAWASASTFRGSDKRGGANGARIRLAPQRDWAVNQPAQLGKVLGVARGGSSQQFNSSGGPGGKRDVAGRSDRARPAAWASSRPPPPPDRPWWCRSRRGAPTPPRRRPTPASFSVLEPRRRWLPQLRRKADVAGAPEALLVDRAQLLTLSAPELTVLIGGLRVLGVTVAGAAHGVLTTRPGALTTDYFVNLLDMGTAWSPAADGYVGRDRATGAPRWTATRVDLVFGSNAQLRALAEVYASADAAPAFVRAFVAAWTKVMELDRFELPGRA